MAPTSDTNQASSTSTTSQQPPPPAPAHKYGPSAVRDVQFDSELKTPYVQLKQRQNGQYVVIERLPVHHRTRHGANNLPLSLAESEVRLGSLKPDWKHTPKVRDEDRRRDTSALSLPPIDLGWRRKAQALVGSLENAHHEPGGGNKSIPRRNVRWDARAKVGSLDNISFRSIPKRTDTSQSDPLSSRRLSSNAAASMSTFEPSPRYGALANAGSLGSNLHYTPGGAGTEVVVKSPRRYEHVRSRVGSLENIRHVPGGGDVLVEYRPARWKAESKIGSLDNAKHSPGGGDVAIVNERLQWQTKSKVGSLANIQHTPGGGQVRIQKEKLQWEGRARVGSLANVGHKPGGGVVRIIDNHLKWVAQPKIDSKPPKTSLMDSLEFLDSY